MENLQKKVPKVLDVLTKKNFSNGLLNVKVKLCLTFITRKLGKIQKDISLILKFNLASILLSTYLRIISSKNTA
jgi:hypothetical protein